MYTILINCNFNRIGFNEYKIPRFNCLKAISIEVCSVYLRYYYCPRLSTFFGTA